MITHWLPCFTQLCPTIQLAGLTTLWAQLPAPTRYPVPKRILAGQGEKLFCSSQTCVAGKCRAPGSHPTPSFALFEPLQPGPVLGPPVLRTAGPRPCEGVGRGGGMGQCPAEMETSGLGLPKRSEEVLCSPACTTVCGT